MEPESKLDIQPSGAGEPVAAADQDSELKTQEPLALHGPIGIRSVSLAVITVVAFILLLRFAQELFIPVVLSILFAYARGGNGRTAAHAESPRCGSGSNRLNGRHWLRHVHPAAPGDRCY